MALFAGLSSIQRIRRPKTFGTTVGLAVGPVPGAPVGGAVSVVGTLLSAETDYRQAAYQRPALILMGNEQQGLPPDMADLCDVNVKIPMRGRADSLNLAVATGIMIYAAT